MTSEDTPRLKAIQISTIPQSYRKQSAPTGQTSPPLQKSSYFRFERFLGGLLHSKWPFAYRMRATSGKAALSFLGPFASSMKAVESSFLAQFSDFSLSDSFPDSSFTRPAAFATITGVPQLSPESLNGLAETMIQSRADCMYQVLVFPRKPSRTKRILTKKRYQSAYGRSQTQESQSGILGGQEIRTRIDPDAVRRSKRYEKEHHRMSAARVLGCQVVLAFWGSSECDILLKNTVSILMASLSSTDKDEQLRVKYLNGEKAVRALEQALTLQFKGKSTQLLPSEAAPLFHIPTIEMAIEPSSPASFSTSGTENGTTSELSKGIPFRQGEISVGSPYRSGTLDIESVKSLTLSDLKHHVFIGGKTGTGKTTTKNRIIIDSWRNGVSSLILEPVKTDARALMGAIPELRLFTMGRENIAPFRMNPFHVEENVSPKLHMGHLHSCFMAAWPVYGMLANHMRRTLKSTYENHGWDLVDELRGIPITLDIFLNEAEIYSMKHIKYGTELSQDFKGAIIARAEDLCDADRAVIFNTTHDITMSELISKPTIIEMDGIGDPEFTSFSLSLILIRVIEHLKKLGLTNELRCLLVIDEAHRVLEEMPRPHDENEAASAKYKATEILVNLIAEARSYGLGIVLVEQIPTRLARNAIKNCHTKIVHKLTSPDDVDLMAAETGCDKEQKAHISALKIGEAVIADPRSIVPADIQVFYDPDFYPDIKRVWTDDDIRERMMPFYDAHPGFAKRPEIPVLTPHRIPIVNYRDAPPSQPIQIEDVVETPTFQNLWDEALTIDKAVPTNHQLEWLIANYACYLGHIHGTPEQTAQVLLEVAVEAYGAPPNPPDMTLIRQLITEAQRRKPDDVRRGRRAP